MPGVDFFDEKYRMEEARNDELFGLNDGNPCAYTTTDGVKEDWNAIVENPDKCTLQFTPVDKNIIILRANGDKNKSCDGMLYIKKKLLCFVELKDAGYGGWLDVVIGQLKSTLVEYGNYNDRVPFKKKICWAANKQHGFSVSFMKRMQEFRNQTGFLLKVGKTLTISSSEKNEDSVVAKVK